MWAESFVQHIQDLYGRGGFDKSSKVILHTYGCGQDSYEDLSLKRLEVVNGNLIIHADDN